MFSILHWLFAAAVIDRKQNVEVVVEFLTDVGPGRYRKDNMR